MQTRNKGKSQSKTPQKVQEQNIQTPKKSAKKIKITSNAENAEKEDKKEEQKQEQQQSIQTIKVNQAQFVQKKDTMVDYKRFSKHNIIGEGAFGKIYKIQTKETKEYRAMKVLKKDKIPDSILTEFINEVNILKNLDNPHILKIYEFYDDSKNYYLITEFINGCNLLTEIIEQENLTEQYICFLMNQLMQGLNYAHLNNLVHRDLKPENIMIQKPEQQGDEDLMLNQIKIIDWGTGVKYEKGNFLTQKCGSVDYASPEVFKGKYDQKCDIWSCGVILYILLSGEHPFGQKTGLSSLQFGSQIKTTEYNFDSEEWQEVSDLSKDLVNKMLEKDPKKRYTAQQVLNHPWFKKFEMNQMNTQETQTLKRTLSRLKNYKVEATIQEAVISYIASHLTNNEDKLELTKTFKMLDKDGNGTLSKEEMIQGYTEMMGKEEATQQVNEIFKLIDIDGDGQISYNEFIACSMDYRQHFTDQKLREAFKLFDKDGNGSINSDEIKQVLGGSLQDNKISQSTWDEVIKQVDQDDDNQISFDEFKILMKRMLKYRESSSQQ